MSFIVSFTQFIIHTTHNQSSHMSCRLCTSGREFDHRDFWDMAQDEFFRAESKVVGSSLSNKQLSKYKFRNGIYYFIGRITNDNSFKQKDLDSVPFLYTHTLAGHLPIVLINSPILYSLVMYIHCKKIPHIGVERMVKEVFKEVMVPKLTPPAYTGF